MRLDFRAVESEVSFESDAFRLFYRRAQRHDVRLGQRSGMTPELVRPVETLLAAAGIDPAAVPQICVARTDEFSVVCQSPLRVCPQKGEMRPEQAAERGVM